jgi:hypothetical protein
LIRTTNRREPILSLISTAMQEALMLIPQIQPKTGDVLKDASKTLTPARTGYTFEIKVEK